MTNGIQDSDASGYSPILGTVLMVAPEQFTLLDAPSVLDQLQLTLLTTTDLNHAFEIWKTDRPDIIVMPISLHGQLVLPLIQLCLEQNPNCQIVVIVNRDQINNAAMAMRAGVVDCLFLPFSTERLLKTIHRAKLRLELQPSAQPLRARAKPKTVSVKINPTKPGLNQNQGSQGSRPDNGDTKIPITKHPGTLLSLLKGQTLAEIERLVIENAIETANGSVTRAAKALDVAPSTLYRKRQGWSDGLKSK